MINPRPSGCCADHHPHTFNTLNCLLGVSMQPSVSIHPSVSIEPSLSSQPSVSIKPSVSIEPSVSNQPSVSVYPSASIQPSFSIQPSPGPPVCSSPDDVTMTLKSWYWVGASWSICEDLCRADPKCNSWMGRNSGNTCYLSEEEELNPRPSGCCADHHPHTFNTLNCLVHVYSE